MLDELRMMNTPASATPSETPLSREAQNRLATSYFGATTLPAMRLNLALLEDRAEIRSKPNMPQENRYHRSLQQALAMTKKWPGMGLRLVCFLLAKRGEQAQARELWQKLRLTTQLKGESEHGSEGNQKNWTRAINVTSARMDLRVLLYADDVDAAAAVDAQLAEYFRRDDWHLAYHRPEEVLPDRNTASRSAPRRSRQGAVIRLLRDSRAGEPSGDAA